MSHNFSASQYERAFLAHRLGNWEVPDSGKLERTSLKNRFDRPQARTGKTQFIAGDNGYLQPKHKKDGVTAFTTTADFQRPVFTDSKPRWPKTNVSWPYAPRATMGYKGIITDYLPSGTVPVDTYQSAGCKDFNF